jgi:WD40 repeat protein
MSDGAADQSANPTVPTPPKRRWFRFSLRTLLVFVLLVGSGMGLWWKWEPWTVLRNIAGRTRLPLFSLDGARLLTTGDQCAYIWDATTGGLLAQLRTPGHKVETASLSPSGARIVTEECSPRAQLRMWDVGSGRELSAVAVTESASELDFLEFSPDEIRVFFHGYFRGIQVWDSESGNVSKAGEADKAWVLERLCRYDGDRVAQRINNGKIPSKLGFLRGTSGGGSVDFTADGKRVVVAYPHGGVDVWDVESGTELTSLAENTAIAATFSPDGERVAVVGRDLNGVLIWHRRRPEYWWGVAWLPEFWLTFAFSAAFIWSVRRDRKTL